MPELNQKVLSRRDDIIRGLRRIIPGEGVISAATELRPYESDGFTAYRQPPMVVVLPETAAQAARDHFLGFEAVSGRAEHFVAGSKVVKNVTGYDRRAFDPSGVFESGRFLDHNDAN
jgi:FAD/FMN-containing dehydrogenase